MSAWLTRTACRSQRTVSRGLGPCINGTLSTGETRPTHTQISTFLQKFAFSSISGDISKNGWCRSLPSRWLADAWLNQDNITNQGWTVVKIQTSVIRERDLITTSRHEKPWKYLMCFVTVQGRNSRQLFAFTSWVQVADGYFHPKEGANSSSLSWISCRSKFVMTETYSLLVNVSYLFEVVFNILRT